MEEDSVRKLSELISLFTGKNSNASLCRANDLGKEEPKECSTRSPLSAERSPGSFQIAEETKIVLTEQFQRAFKLVKSRAPFIFITGRAGTGKSTFTQLLKDRLESYAVVAPTGVAALNVGGQTIHSFFRIPPGPIDFSKIQRLNNRKAFQALHTVIIDEISMVRADLLDAIELTLRRNGPYPELPFGGVQIVAVGDLFQLPPIVSSEEEQAFLRDAYSSPFFFSAGILKTLPIETIEFSEVFRQKEERFIEILNKVREGRRLNEALALLNERVRSLSAQAVGGIILTGDNNSALKINTARLSDIGSESVAYRGKITGDFKIESSKLPAPFELDLKRGSQVMFVKNDLSKRWVNGTLGVVVELGADFVMVSIRDQAGERVVRAEAAVWENLKFIYDSDENRVRSEKIGTYSQIPLTLAWAVTIHKSQGKTFDRVHVDLSRGAFAEGQVYVALSRCRTLEGVTLERAIEREDIHLNHEVVQFSDTMIGG